MLGRSHRISCILHLAPRPARDSNTSSFPSILPSLDILMNVRETTRRAPAVPVPALHAALCQLQKHSASLPSPASVPKRASIAVVLRIQPEPAYRPAANESPASSLDELFQRSWVHHGEPEVLFIKRAARKGDRWTAHVACPGGKRDPEDACDADAAVRETMEEIGLDLGREAIACGKLPDRVVTTSWGTVPLMVLCPFVYLINSASPPVLNLQPSEIASAHWVPLRILLAPAFRAYEKCDVSDRLARQVTGVIGRAIRLCLRLSLGQMVFAAIRLWPSHSVYSTFGTDFLAPIESGVWESPLLLWGLTLGVIEDLLETLPPLGASLDMWQYPTFTAWDVRAVVWFMTRGLRKRNLEAARGGSLATSMMAPKGFDKGATGVNFEDYDVGESGILIREVDSWAPSPPVVERTSSVDVLLRGYYGVVTRAVWITLCSRATLGLTVAGLVAWRRWRH